MKINVTMTTLVCPNCKKNAFNMVRPSQNEKAIKCHCIGCGTLFAPSSLVTPNMVTGDLVSEKINKPRSANMMLKG